MKSNLKNKFIKNLSYAFIAQFMSMFISIIVNLILPKYINENNFSYWQLFVFYSQYIPFLHLGLNDGVYLRYGGQKIAELDKDVVWSQLIIGLLYQFILSIVLLSISSIFVQGYERRVILFFSIGYFMVFTAQNYLGYIFQAINETAWYSKSILINRVLFAVLVLILKNRDAYIPIVAAYIFAQTISLFYCIYKGRFVLFSRFIGWKPTLMELRSSISVGIKLLLANIASMLILGSNRQIIDSKWGIIAFGKVSFAITLTNFILTFIQQVGMVLFPMLRQMSKDYQKDIFSLCNKVLCIFLPVIFIFYFPLKAIISVWLPNYAISLKYLGLLLPICFFDIKTQMLCNTYMKVLRKEKVLFNINIICMILSITIGTIGAYIFDNLYIVIFSMVLAIAIRSISSELFLERLLDLNFILLLIKQCVFVVLYMCTICLCKDGTALAIIAIMYSVYCISNRQYIKEIWLYIKNKTVRIKLHEKN